MPARHFPQPVRQGFGKKSGGHAYKPHFPTATARMTLNSCALPPPDIFWYNFIMEHGFLKEKYGLHNAPEVEKAAERKEQRSGEKASQNPEARIQNYLDRLERLVLD